MSNESHLAAELSFRRANISDSAHLLRWRNTEGARKFSRNQQLIDLVEHQNWFTKKIEDPNCLILIFQNGEDLVGFSRLDLQNQMALRISIVVDPEYQGFGYGKFFLSQSLIMGKKNYSVKKFEAEIHKENEVSIKLFTAFGFSTDLENCVGDYCIYSIVAS